MAILHKNKMHRLKLYRQQKNTYYGTKLILSNRLTFGICNGFIYYLLFGRF